jgi:uncharacterized protein (DUF4415 family)
MANNEINDPDNPEWTTKDFANARPVSERHGEAFARSLIRPNDRPFAIPGERKQAISIRLDRDIVAALKASGPGWQTRVNEALRRTNIDGGVGSGLSGQSGWATQDRLAA